MTFVAGGRMEWILQPVLLSVLRSVLLVACLLLVLTVSLSPGLWSIGVRLHSAFTGSYVPGHHSVLLINSPNEQAAKDIGRAIMERRLAASINILFRTSTMYYWKGEIQDASEVLMLVKTKTARIQQVIDYVSCLADKPYRNRHPVDFYPLNYAVNASFSTDKTQIIRQSVSSSTSDTGSVHPYANPEVLSFPVEDGSLAYMKWMDEAIPDD